GRLRGHATVSPGELSRRRVSPLDRSDPQGLLQGGSHAPRVGWDSKPRPHGASDVEELSKPRTDGAGSAQADVRPQASRWRDRQPRCRGPGQSPRVPRTGRADRIGLQLLPAVPPENQAAREHRRKFITPNRRTLRPASSIAENLDLPAESFVL